MLFVAYCSLNIIDLLYKQSLVLLIEMDDATKNIFIEAITDKLQILLYIVSKSTKCLKMRFMMN